MIVRVQLAYAGAPLVNSNGTNMLAPILFSNGTEEQQARRTCLPSPAPRRCGRRATPSPKRAPTSPWLRMTARRDGDEYVLNGQKTWTSNGRLADWMFVLARTDDDVAKPQAGISFLLVDLRTPGITISPIRSLTGYPTFAEEFFEDVRIPVENLVGPENDGWRIAKGVARSSNGRTSLAAQSQRLRRRVDRLVPEEGGFGRRPAALPGEPEWP